MIVEPQTESEDSAIRHVKQCHTICCAIEKEEEEHVCSI